MKRESLTHEFVEYMPDKFSDGVVYISIPFATAAHLCCCGCKKEVVTPISPTDWTISFDGKTVSFDPSIGNWSFPCQSHYWIEKNKVAWASKWSDEKINAGRRFDKYKKNDYYDSSTPTIKQKTSGTPTTKEHKNSEGFLEKIKSWWK